MVKIPLHYKKHQCGIYCIRNRVNGKIYIGSSQNAYERWSTHKYRLDNDTHKNPHLQSAWNRYGKKKFDCFLIEECDKSKLIEREQWYLDTSGCLNNATGYNINIKADRVAHTDEQRLKMSISLTGKNHPNFGKHLSIETKRRIGIAQVGPKNHNFGKVTPVNVRRKISKAESGKFHYNYDHAIYTFLHSKYGIEKCTKHDLKMKYGLSHISDLVSGKRKSEKGWSI